MRKMCQSLLLYSIFFQMFLILSMGGSPMASKPPHPQTSSMKTFRRTAEEIQIGVISDMHLSPKYDPEISNMTRCQNIPTAHKDITIAPYGRKGCDSPISLVTSSLQQMKLIIEHPDAILYPGDLLGHEIPLPPGSTVTQEHFMLVEDTARTAINLMVRNYQNTPIIFTFGNDDLLIHNEIPKAQNLTLKHKFYELYYDLWIRNVHANREMDNEENYNSFLTGGYFYHDLTADIRILSLNSMYFLERTDPTWDPDAQIAQLMWVEQQFKELKKYNKQAILLFHIPVGYFEGRHNIRSYWSKEYYSWYSELTYKYKEYISLTLCGHIHQTDLRIDTRSDPKYGYKYALRQREEAHYKHKTEANIRIQKSETQIGIYNDQNFIFYNNMIMHRAVSPIFANNPGFIIHKLHYTNHKLIPMKMIEYTFMLNETYNTTQPPDIYWEKLYETDRDLNIESLNPSGIKKFLSDLQIDEGSTKNQKYYRYKLGFAAEEEDEEEYEKFIR